MKAYFSKITDHYEDGTSSSFRILGTNLTLTKVMEEMVKMEKARAEAIAEGCPVTKQPVRVEIGSPQLESWEQET